MKQYIKADYSRNSMRDIGALSETGREAEARTSTNPEILEVLSYDPSALVRAGVAANKNTSKDILQEFIDNDQDTLVVLLSVLNPNSGISLKSQYDILWELFDKCRGMGWDNCDPDYILWDTLIPAIGTSPYITYDGATRLINATNWGEAGYELSKNEAVSQDILEGIFDHISINGGLSDEFDWTICTHLAQNKNTPEDVLGKIYRLGNYVWDTDIPRYLAENPNTPTDVLQALAEEAIPEIAEVARNNSNYLGDDEQDEEVY